MNSRGERRIGDRRLEKYDAVDQELLFDSRCVRTSDRSDAIRAQREGLLLQLNCDRRGADLVKLPFRSTVMRAFHALATLGSLVRNDTTSIRFP